MMSEHSQLVSRGLCFLALGVSTSGVASAPVSTRQEARVDHLAQPQREQANHSRSNILSLSDSLHAATEGDLEFESVMMIRATYDATLVGVAKCTSSADRQRESVVFSVSSNGAVSWHLQSIAKGIGLGFPHLGRGESRIPFMSWSGIGEGNHLFVVDVANSAITEVVAYGESIHTAYPLMFVTQAMSGVAVLESSLYEPDSKYLSVFPVSEDAACARAFVGADASWNGIAIATTAQTDPTVLVGVRTEDVDRMEVGACHLESMSYTVDHSIPSLHQLGQTIEGPMAVCTQGEGIVVLRYLEGKPQIVANIGGIPNFISAIGGDGVLIADPKTGAMFRIDFHDGMERSTDLPTDAKAPATRHQLAISGDQSAWLLWANEDGTSQHIALESDSDWRSWQIE